MHAPLNRGIVLESKPGEAKNGNKRRHPELRDAQASTDYKLKALIDSVDNSLSATVGPDRRNIQAQCMRSSTPEKLVAGGRIELPT